MDELERFLQLFIESLQEVDQDYYQTVYRNLSALRGGVSGRALSRRGRFIDDDFIRYSERIFCYELYHQLRRKFDDEKELNPNFLQDTKIQAEVKKMQVASLIQHFGLQALGREFIPDILVHTPGDAEYHPFVIEVKCMDNVSEAEVWYDIDKINHFITRYNYQRGIFLSVNSDFNYLRDIIANLSEHIEGLEGCEGIKVIGKTSQNTEATIWGMNDGHFQVLEANNE